MKTQKAQWTTFFFMENIIIVGITSLQQVKPAILAIELWQHLCVNMKLEQSSEKYHDKQNKSDGNIFC